MKDTPSERYKREQTNLIKEPKLTKESSDLLMYECRAWSPDNFDLLYIPNGWKLSELWALQNHATQPTQICLQVSIKVVILVYSR